MKEKKNPPHSKQWDGYKCVYGVHQQILLLLLSALIRVHPRPISSFFLLSSVLCVALGCGKSPEAKEEEEHHAPVKVVTATKARLGEWTELLGTTQPLPNRVARISAAVEGHVQSVLLQNDGEPLVEGQQVKAGQVIARLDDRVLRANRAKVVAQLTELIEQKQQAGYAVNKAKIELKRLQGLRRGASGGSSLVAQVEIEKAEIDLDDARSKQRGMKAREATLIADRNAIDTQLEYFALRAPITGRLGMLHARPGDTVHPGTVIADVVDLNEIDVLCFVPPRTATQLALGQPARLAGQDKPTGKVIFVAVQAQPDTGNFAVKVRFPNRNLALRANSVIRVHVQTSPEVECLVIPEAALLEDQEPPAVVLVRDLKVEKDKEDKEEKTGKALKVRAIIGFRDHERGVVQIKHLEGADPKEKIAVKDALFVTEGVHGLHDDDKLKIEDNEPGK